jgi:hypothetical protein
MRQFREVELPTAAAGTVSQHEFNVKMFYLQPTKGKGIVKDHPRVCEEQCIL